jgi:uncharacterized protein
MAPKVSGIEPGQRQLNGPQTTGREYRNLSQPTFTMMEEDDIEAPMRDGVYLLADVFRPSEPGRYPVLIAASPYPRQIQNLGVPAGFIESGASDFFVPRGYAHIIANLRGTGGSGGTYTYSDHQEREDLYDLVEWAAVQPWSDGNVGMIGISYFAGTQMAAAVERPPHLKAIMPIAGTYDFYQSTTHNGLLSSSFITPFLYMIGMTSSHTNKPWRSKLVDAMRAVLLTPGIHKKFENTNGEAAIASIKVLLNLHHNPHPWDDLWRAVAAEHPFHDAWWEDRSLLPLLDKVEIPVYMGCDWDNVTLHLPHTFTGYERLKNAKHVRVAMMGRHGLAWPWESLHIEALAWYDHWLKGKDTGILEGPHFRYVLPKAEGWRATDTWPLPDAVYHSFALRADGILSEDEGAAGVRTYMNLGAGLRRPGPSETDPPSHLQWDSQPLSADLDMTGPIELQLDAACTAPDTAFMAVLLDMDENEQGEIVSAGYLRAGLRAVDESASKPGAPLLPCTAFEPVPIGEKLRYRIPIVPNARRFHAGHKIRVLLTTDDQDEHIPAPLEFRHASIGTSSFNTVFSSSRLLLPVVK